MTEENVVVDEQTVENVKIDDASAPYDPPEGGTSEPSPVSLIDKLNQATLRAEQANKVTAELIARQERLRVQSVLGGSASAGAPILSDEEKKNANAKKFLEGTGFEDEIFPSK